MESPAASCCQRHRLTCVIGAGIVILVVVVIAEYFIVDEVVTEDAESSSSTADTFVDIFAIPDGFIMAAATSAYQVEGAWNSSGKGANIWDTWTHEHPEKIKDGSNGDVACNSYNLYKTDIQMLVQTGFNAYRFSISWSRVLPNGTSDYVNSEGVQYYHDLLDELLAYNITPLVTMYHFDLPEVLNDTDGWINSSIADSFEDYADFLYSEYGSKVKYWITINEPSSTLYGYGRSLLAPGYGELGVTDYIVTHNLLRAHGRAYRLYDEKYRATQNGSVGITYFIRGQYPNNASDPGDIEAVDRAWAFDHGLFGHAIYSKEGNYPSIVRERVDNNSYAEGRSESRLPHFTADELELIKGSYDFIGVNHYNSSYVTTLTNGSSPSMARDSGVSNVRISLIGDGLRLVLNYIKSMYGNIPMLITESGLGLPSGAGTNDSARIIFYNDMLTALFKAYYEDGCNVIGYTAWSIMDNFEWNSGYSYGLWEVDFDSDNRTRTMKKSAYYFQELLSTGKLPNITDYL